jgi:hypothetical protein
MYDQWKKMLFAALLISLPAHASWIVVNSNETGVAYVDPDTKTRDGNIASIWVLRNPTNPAPGSFKSLKTLVEFDCAGRMFRVVEQEGYPEPFAKGTPTTTFSRWMFRLGSKWESADPGTTVGDALTAACKP